MSMYPKISINREPLPPRLERQGEEIVLLDPSEKRVTSRELYSWTVTANAKDVALKQEESRNKYSGISLIPPLISIS